MNRDGKTTMIGAVFALFISLIIVSILSPVLNDAQHQALQETAKADQTGAAGSVVKAAESVPDPVGDAKEASGGVLYWLLINHPIVFMLSQEH